MKYFLYVLHSTINFLEFEEKLTPKIFRLKEITLIITNKKTEPLKVDVKNSENL